MVHAAAECRVRKFAFAPRMVVLQAVPGYGLRVPTFYGGLLFSTS